jgi:N-acetylmuramoyl-L-alanine amidase
MKNFGSLLLALLLLGCMRGPHLDHSYRARSQDSRAQFLILHFTECDWETARATLVEGEVSSHYLVRDSPAKIYQLVDENHRAYHAGASSWKGQTNLNAASIGIEIVNLGNAPGQGGGEYPEYPKAQADAVIALVKDIVARHRIRPDRILGHSDIAPQRKVDPGPRFFWKRLAEEGLIPWPDPTAVAAARQRHEAVLPTIAWFQTRLAAHGFETPRGGQLDDATKRVLMVFQMKYRPERYDGIPDAETAAILEVLTTAPTKAP